MFRMDKGERYSTWIKKKAWVKTQRLAEYNIFKSYKEINITDIVELRKTEWHG